MNRTKKKPFISTIKRAELASRDVIILRIAALVFAMAAGGIFILVVGYNPLLIYGTIFHGAFRSTMAVQATIKIMIPLLITSLGVAIAFKMKFWNIGAEGQMIMGGVFASYFALFHGDWPRAILIVVMFAAGFIGGGIWGLIPAHFKCKYNTNETLLTLMFNYIALYTIVFLRDGPWRDPANPGFSKIATFGKNAQLAKLFGVHLGWVFALFILVFVFIFFRYTKRGYEIEVVGESQATARYAGMNVRKVVLKTIFLSGGICGIAGMAQATGSDLTLAVGIAGGVGFTAIIVAWLANLNVAVIFFFSAFFSVLVKGSSVVQSDFGLSMDCAAVLQGIILFFIIGCEFFIRYKFVFRSKEVLQK